MINSRINALKDAQWKCNEAKSKIHWAAEQISKTLKGIDKSISPKGVNQIRFHLASIFSEEELRLEHELAEAYRKITEDR